jgi:membrane-associated phospholipid phosphatase
VSIFGRLKADHTLANVGVLQRTMATLAAWIGAFDRPARGYPQLAGRASEQAAMAALLVVAIIATMVFLDAAAIGTARKLPPVLSNAAEVITAFGLSGWFLWPIGGVLVVIAALTRPAVGRVGNLVAATLAVRLGFLFVAIGIPGLVFSILKRLVGRVRPSDLGPFYFVPFSWRPDYASMPSGHTTGAFAAAVAIGAIWPRARVGLWLYAGVIAVSRVVVLAHYPSDVLGGAFAGAFGAIITRRFFASRRRGFGVGSDGRVRAFPGPSWRRLKALAARLFTHDDVAGG